jgi:hypothetical protein
MKHRSNKMFPPTPRMSYLAEAQKFDASLAKLARGD